MAKTTLYLSTSEIETVLQALQAVAPSGGGSDYFHLSNKISARSGVSANQRSTGYAALTAHNEVREAFFDSTDIMHDLPE